MFDIEKMRQKGIPEESIKIMERVNENNRRREKCAGHDFEMVGFGRFRCKNCGYEADGSYVGGYNEAVRHMEGKKVHDGTN